jgi:phospholipase/carboxylesterase
MGAVMSYTLALSADRPEPAGIMAFSGFVPTVEGWQPSLVGRRSMRAFIAHGGRDDVISVDFARDARELLEGGGLTVEYHESRVGHRIDVDHLESAADWLDATLLGA